MWRRVWSLELGIVTAFAVAVLVVACGQDGGVLPTAPTAPPSSSVELGRAGTAGLGNNSNGNTNQNQNQNANENLNENLNENVGLENDNRNENVAFECPTGVPTRTVRQRGLVREVVDMPGMLFEVGLLVVDGRELVVTGETELTRELDDGEPAVALADLRPGLPVRTVAVECDGAFIAVRVRVDDELKVTGIVEHRDDGSFTLLVEGLDEPLEFVLADDAEIDPFEEGDRVRVEARVPVDLDDPFVATEVEID